MKKLFPLAVAAALLLPAAPVLAAPGVPAPRILVLNRAAILQLSKVGKDVARQVQAYGNQAKAQLAGQAKALQAEGQQLQQQIAILAPDVKKQKIAAFQAKQDALQGEAQRREAAIQGGLMKAQQTIEQTLGPILQNIMQQRGANMILDKNAVVFANSTAFDITPEAIAQLDQKLSSLKVTLVQPPAGASGAGQ